MSTRRGLTLFATSLLAGVALSGVPAHAQSPSAGASCTPLAPAVADPAAAPGDLTVYAAASLTDAFEDIGNLWAAATPGSRLVLSLDASSALRTQIEEGATADVFASADTRNARTLVDECLVPAPLTPFAQNELVIVVPEGNPAGIETPADLGREGLRVIAALPDVPITKYTTQVIANLAALDGYPEDFADAVTANTVSEEDNVRAVLAKIELGEGDAAIVYATDARSSGAVDTIDIPDEANVLATYAAVMVGTSAQPALAADFLGFLTSPASQGVLASYGFIPVEQEPSESPAS